MKRRILLLLCLVGGMAALHADVKITDIVVKPRWPWNGLVDITYKVECKEKDENGKDKDVYLDFEGIDNDRKEKDGTPQKVKMKSLTGQGAKDPVKDGGPYTVTWNMAKDAPAFNYSSFNVKIHAIAGIAPYLVIDLQTWKKRYTSQSPNIDDDTCRTTELWLRQIPAGTFEMGTGIYTPFNAIFTQMFYIGLFECTQKQWELVMGDNPSYFKGDCRPVEYVSYNMIRGTGAQAGAGWPTYGHAVDNSSFMGKLREKTGLTFDLPTEAQWEYAARGGSESQRFTYSGSNNIDEVAWYYNNSSSRTHDVGKKKPNELELYDMSGNVWEWCLDWYGNYGTAVVSDPLGPNSGSNRVERGGCWGDYAGDCRSANRFGHDASSYSNGFGFRVVCLPLVR